MKKRIFLLLALMICAMLLCGCSSAPENTSAAVYQPDPLALPTTALVTPKPQTNTGDQDAYLAGSVQDAYGNKVYAGATPILLNPIDMPTATPKPSLVFGYTPFDFENLGLRFDAPQGWYLDSSAPNTITLLDPNTYDGVQASISVSITSVDKDYELNDVKQTLNDTLKELSRNYVEWEQRVAGSKTQLKKDGYYNRYTARTVEGAEVRGQVRIALLDGNRIITVILTAPGGYADSYVNVLDHIRETMKLL